MAINSNKPMLMSKQVPHLNGWYYFQCCVRHLQSINKSVTEKHTLHILTVFRFKKLFVELLELLQIAGNGYLVVRMGINIHCLSAKSILVRSRFPYEVKKGPVYFSLREILHRPIFWGKSLSWALTFLCYNNGIQVACISDENHL